LNYFRTIFITSIGLKASIFGSSSPTKLPAKHIALASNEGIF